MMARLDPRTAYHPAPAKREIGILGLIEWAFQRECAELDFEELQSTAGERPSVSPVWALAQQKQLGCSVDGGGRTGRHADADMVASALSALPVERGGKSMAVWVAQLARAGMRPDWMPDARTRCRPIATHRNRHGCHAKTEVCGTEVVISRGKRRSIDLRWCPVTFSPTPAKIASVRRDYLRWWDALHDLRMDFQRWHSLNDFSVTDQMPSRTPWRRG